MGTVPLSVLGRRDLHLELGCGSSKRDPSSLGIDILPGPMVDLVGDALEVLRELSTGSVQLIYSEHFLEHVDYTRELLDEACRVLAPGGRFTAVVPHYSNPYFYSDPTHRAYYGLYTFSYYVVETPFRRRVPRYATPVPLRLLGTTMIFKAGRPFYGRHVIVKVLGSWVNLTRWTQEFYEGHLCWLLPCYELRFELTRSDVQ